MCRITDFERPSFRLQFGDAGGKNAIVSAAFLFFFMNAITRLLFHQRAWNPILAQYRFTSSCATA